MRTTGLVGPAMLIVLIAGGVLAMGASPAGQEGIRRTDLQRHDLSVAGREVVQVRVDFDQGAAFPKHRHPGEEIVNVLEGSLEYRIEDQPPVTLHAGDVLFIPAGASHSARNVGRGTGSELATYIVEKGKPLVVLAETPTSSSATSPKTMRSRRPGPPH